MENLGVKVNPLIDRRHLTVARALKMTRGARSPSRDLRSAIAFNADELRARARAREEPNGKSDR
jgi:hypothetical protein